MPIHHHKVRELNNGGQTASGKPMPNNTISSDLMEGKILQEISISMRYQNQKKTLFFQDGGYPSQVLLNHLHFQVEATLDKKKSVLIFKKKV